MEKEKKKKTTQDFELGHLAFYPSAGLRGS